MKIHRDKLEWKRGENGFFIVLRAKSTLNPKIQGGQRCEERSKVVNFIF